MPVTDVVISGTIDLLLRYDEQGKIVGASVVDFKTMEGGPDPTQNDKLAWDEHARQVQL